MSENTILVFISEIKIDLTLKKSFFLVSFFALFAQKLFISSRQPSGQSDIKVTSFCVKFDAASMCTWYDDGCKPSLQLKYV